MQKHTVCRSLDHFGIFLLSCLLAGCGIEPTLLKVNLLNFSFSSGVIFTKITQRMSARNLTIYSALVVAVALAAIFIWRSIMPSKGSLIPAEKSNSPLAFKPTLNPSSLATQAPTPKQPPYTSPLDRRPRQLYTKDTRDEFFKARAAAFENNPALKIEEIDLTTQRIAIMNQKTPPSVADRTAFMAKWADHEKKVRAAMIQADPGMQAVFAHVAARQAADFERIKNSYGPAASAGASQIQPAPSASAASPPNK
jgi:hypothetical protein